MQALLPEWLHPWMPYIATGAQVTLVVLGAWVLRVVLRHTVTRLGARHGLPPEFSFTFLRVGSVVIVVAALLLVLDRLGVSATVIWTALTGFTAVAAVAFFAAWSVLSNVFCSLLIFTTRLFRLHDQVELLENGHQPGFKGQVIDITLIYTTLRENNADGSQTILQLPNSMFFQRALRCWRVAEPPV